MPVIIHEDVHGGILRALRYGAWALDHVDPGGRLSRVAIVAAVTGADYFGWRTRAEHEQSPDQAQVYTGPPPEPVGLSPPDRARAALRMNANEIAQDLCVRLRRARQRPG